MDTRAAHSILWGIYQTVSDYHQHRIYFYTLDDVIKVNHTLAARLVQQPPAFRDLCDVLVGEAQIEMLYESADASVLGVDISKDAQNEIFMEHLKYRIDTALNDLATRCDLRH